MEAVNLSPSTGSAVVENIQPGAGVGSEHRAFQPLYDRFAATSNPHTDRILSEIWDWAKSQAPLDDKDSVLWEITKLSNRIGSPHIGEKPWTKLISYISTYNQLKASETRLKEMEASV
jgi:hypothetical protein